MNKASILIVDDDPGMAETMSDILQDMGYRVAFASDGYRAIKMFGEHKFDIVLMDIKMPGINGVETFKEVKKISPATKVIMMTAFSVEDLIREAVKEGAFGVMYKPLDPLRIVRLIEHAKKGSLVMLVDDDPSYCQTVSDVLKEEGYRVSVSHSGQEAVNTLKKEPADIVFIDVMMPVMNGLETFKEIKKINPAIIAVMVTGYRHEVGDLVEEALSETAYTCLYKPLDMKKIVDLIERISEEKRRGKL